MNPAFEKMQTRHIVSRTKHAWRGDAQDDGEDLHGQMVSRVKLIVDSYMMLIDSIGGLLILFLGVLEEYEISKCGWWWWWSEDKELFWYQEARTLEKIDSEVIVFVMFLERRKMKDV